MTAPPVLARFTVPPEWIDYNGHMNEARYLQAASETTDALLAAIGAGPAYAATGFSYYTVETHILHRREARLGDRLEGSVQILAADPRRLHLWVELRRDGVLLASVEQMLLHVDRTAGRSVPAPAAVMDRLGPLAAAHAALPRPVGAGRRVGERP